MVDSEKNCDLLGDEQNIRDSEIMLRDQAKMFLGCPQYTKRKSCWVADLEVYIAKKYLRERGEEQTTKPKRFGNLVDFQSFFSITNTSGLLNYGV